MRLDEFLRARLDEDEAAVRDWQESYSPHHPLLGDPARVLAEVEAKRRILELHEPQVITWPKADNVNPYVEQHCIECGTGTQSGGPGDPGDFEPVDWPCPTLRLLALPYADHPEYPEE